MELAATNQSSMTSSLWKLLAVSSDGATSQVITSSVTQELKLETSSANVMTTESQLISKKISADAKVLANRFQNGEILKSYRSGVIAKSTDSSWSSRQAALDNIIGPQTDSPRMEMEQIAKENISSSLQDSSALLQLRSSGITSYRDKVGSDQTPPFVFPVTKLSPSTGGNSSKTVVEDAFLQQTTELIRDSSASSIPKNISKELILGVNVKDHYHSLTGTVNSNVASENVTSVVRRSSEVSSAGFPNALHDLIETGQEIMSNEPSPNLFDNFVYHNVTMATLVPCQFPNTSSNVTDLEIQKAIPYDFMADLFDVNIEASTAALVAKATTLALLAVTGVAGNALVIWSVVRQRHLHRPPFYYLLSLSLTDLSRAAFCLPLVLMTLLQGSVWRHGSSACDLFAFANSFFVLSSGVSLLDIAADRHLSLVYSRSYKRRAGGAVNLVVVLLGWTLAFLVAFPPVVGVGAYAFEESEGQCTLRHKFFRHDNDTLGFLMVFTALMMITLFLYYRIFLALRSHRKMKPLDHEPARSSTWTFVGPGANGQAFINWMNGFGGNNVGHVANLARNHPRPNRARILSLQLVKNQHVTRLFFLMTLTFHALWLPYQVLSYWRVFGATEEINAGFVTTAAWLSYGQVAACPLMYFSSRGSMRRRPSRADLSPEDKQECLLESLNRKK